MRSVSQSPYHTDADTPSARAVSSTMRQSIREPCLRSSRSRSLSQISQLNPMFVGVHRELNDLIFWCEHQGARDVRDWLGSRPAVRLARRLQPELERIQ